MSKSLTRIIQDAETAADCIADGAINQLRDAYETHGWGVNTSVYHEAINQILVAIAVRIDSRMYDIPSEEGVQ
jgi:hypothetical protein